MLKLTIKMKSADLPTTGGSVMLNQLVAWLVLTL